MKNTSRSLDQFFTKSEIAAYCIEKTTEYLSKSMDEWMWVEPSAGNGSFYNLLNFPKIGLDLMSRHSEIIEVDFLKWSPQKIHQRIVIIGNPPFGKNSSLSRKFFDHASTFADVIAFILPRTFEKPLFINRLDRRMHLAASYPMIDCAFEFEGAPYSVPTVFQIWKKRNILRPITKSVRHHQDFAFVSPDAADFAFQRVGTRAGMVSVEGLNKSPQSHYFLKAFVPYHTLFKRLHEIDWEPIKRRTAGNPSIGKGELVETYQLAYG